MAPYGASAVEQSEVRSSEVASNVTTNENFRRLSRAKVRQKAISKAQPSKVRVFSMVQPSKVRNNQCFRRFSRGK